MVVGKILNRAKSPIINGEIGGPPGVDCMGFRGTWASSLVGRWEVLTGTVQAAQLISRFLRSRYNQPIVQA